MADGTGADAAALWAKGMYQADLPPDIARFRHLLETYSGIAPEDVDAHLHDIVRHSLESNGSPTVVADVFTSQRDKAWAVARFPCLGRWSFTNLSLVDDPVFRSAVARLKDPRSGDALLDVACCLGQVIRQLVADGVSPARLHGTDLSPAFLDLGFELFRDRERFPADAFVAADLLADPADAAQGEKQEEGGEDRESAVDAALRGKVTLVHAANFFHLFSWEEQVRAASRIVSFLQPGRTDAVVFGAQIGCLDPAQAEFRPIRTSTSGSSSSNDGSTGSSGNSSGKEVKTVRYLHDPASWQRLWDEVGAATGTRWRVEAQWVGGLPFRIPGFPEKSYYLKFAVYQI
ncbi:porphobilinogen deaminase protein [Purpureocillium lilacinum]|uniref:Porphobilinogen deaminase protein n=1 Tax=Purpureocillium lilacinum TaxID=33203 RepID=A0A179GXM8_PURLI|nr:porphobilinogen deaminase protein [Purpureocillium lilacinum]OAQ82644.1 porphobilinogen deaminase protein [Purpureocillium lilacinum]